NTACPREEGGGAVVSVGAGDSRTLQAALSVLLAAGRVKRGWVWNQFFVVEEYTGTEPLYVGKIHSDSDEGDGSIKYTISGEGAGTIFLIDELTGDIHATERLDREQKTFYTLRAQARDRQTDRLLEPESEFIIKVQDINDSEPRFLEGPYIGSVAELAPIGTSVMQVTASDADDPSYGSSARVVYSVLEGEQHFTVDSKTGVIRTAVANLDRETQDRYEVVIRATDMAGQLGGLSGSTTVTIVITDVNDNPPRFPQKMYQFSIAETAPMGTPIGRVKAEDSDVGENTDMTYQIKDEEGLGAFRVTTDGTTQEAIIAVQKVRRQRGLAPTTGLAPRKPLLSRSSLEVPVAFHPPSAAKPVAHGSPSPLPRYAIDRSSDQEQIFDIDVETGAVVTGKVLDRETAGWHNLTVLAMEAGEAGGRARKQLRSRSLTPVPAAGVNEGGSGSVFDEVRVGCSLFTQPALSLLFPDNTAAVHTQRVGFNRQEQDIFFLPILVVDSGPPALSSTGTLTIRVCGCDSAGAILSCNTTAYAMSATLSPGALIALLVCILILVVLVLLILTLKRHHKGHLASEEDEDMRDNVIKYNDEGGGEQDTEAYDMSALRSLYDFSELKGGGEGGGLPGDGGLGGSPDLDFSMFRDYITKKVEQADEDLSVPPYDSFQTYAFEGLGSPVPSLSSINTWSTSSEQDFSHLSSWGPRFRQLAALYVGYRGEDDGEES
uniref:Cadherin-22 n=1 Tax=Sphenodon punctatus TaxID=8508 RepID=A0A8D0H422_SPHPU